MISLALAISCSVVIAFILKVNEERSGNRIVVLAANYLMATGIGLLLIRDNSRTLARLVSPEMILFSMLVGLSFAVTFFLYMKAVRLVGVGLATLIARISIVIPVLLSGFIYLEAPTHLQVTGIVLTLIVFVLFARSLGGFRTGDIGTSEVLTVVLLFVLLGLNDFSMKIFREWQNASLKLHFLVGLFGTAAVLTWGAVLFRRTDIHRSDLMVGGLLGIPNLFASFFLIDALQTVQGIIAYPVLNASVIFLTMIGGVLFWQETLNKYGWASLALAMLAVIFLSR